MTHDEILKAARERLAEIGDDAAHDKERENLLTVVHGPRCQFCRQHECSTKWVMARAPGPMLFNGVPCMMGSGGASLSIDVTDYDRA